MTTLLSEDVEILKIPEFTILMFQGYEISSYPFHIGYDESFRLTGIKHALVYKIQARIVEQNETLG